MSQPTPARRTSSRCCAWRCTPVDPPESLKTRVETTLQELTDAAVDELEALGARRDARPAQLGAPGRRGAVGATAGTALVVLRVRQQQRKTRAAQSRNPLDLAAAHAARGRRRGAQARAPRLIRALIRSIAVA